MYVLKHKNFHTYLCKRYGNKRYLLDIKYAEKFSKKKAEERIKKFLHPENWEIIEIKKRRI